MRAQRYLETVLLIFLTGTVLSCNGDELADPSTGALSVTVTTSGSAPDPDGYTLQLDSNQPLAIATEDQFQHPNVLEGEHVVLLGGIAPNCGVVGENPRSIVVTPNATAEISFEVTCAESTGSLAVITSTTGESIDSDGFTISIDGGPPRPVSANGRITISGLAPGAHTVALAEVAGNCIVAEGSSQSVTLTPGASVSVQFTLACGSTGISGWSSIPLPPSVSAEIGWYTSRSLWGTSPSNLFVVGSATQPSPRSSVWHYNGIGWTEQVSRVDTTLVGIWGSSPTDVFAIGRPADWQPGASAILHYDGSSWSDMPGPEYSPAGFTQYDGIWGASPAEIFLAGRIFRSSPTTELLARFDGSRWSELPTPGFGENAALTDIAGTSASDVWAIGSRQKCEDCNYDRAIVVHYDGLEWREVLVVGNDFFHGVWAIAPNDVWVVGKNAEFNANVLHYDGSGWSRGEPLPTSENGLNDVWASSASDVYAVGPGILIHYDGTGWTKVAHPGGDRVWGTSTGDLFVLRTNEILHRKR